jgi:hypothetical protein
MTKKVYIQTLSDLIRAEILYTFSSGARVKILENKLGFRYVDELDFSSSELIF